MASGHNIFIFIKFFLLISLICRCNCEDSDEGSGVKLKTRPKYTELRRPQRVTSSTTEKPEEVSDEEEDDEVSEEVHVESNPDAAEPPKRTKEYVEFIRPGATPRSKTTTTRAPKRKVDKKATPNGCTACRYYCKQCKGSEEVSSGGVWGCCNHNCCGGRCSCQKVM